MKPSKSMRLLSMTIIGLYAVLNIFALNREVLSLLSVGFSIITILAAAGVMILAWKRPRIGGMLVFGLALALFLFGSFQSINIYGANSGGFVVIMAVLSLPLALAGILLLAAQRAIEREQ